jgi:hypothetical protein
MENFKFDSFRLEKVEVADHLNPDFDINKEKKKLRESNNKLLFKIKETKGERESSASDLIYSDNISEAEEEPLIPSPTPGHILDATRSNSAKNLLAKKDTFKMPS